MRPLSPFTQISSLIAGFLSSVGPVLALALLLAASARAATPAVQTPPVASEPGAKSSLVHELPSSDKPSQPWGASYYAFFYGPGLTEDTGRFPPNAAGLPADDGMSVYAYVSVQYKLTSRWALDWQNRVQWFFNNGVNAGDFRTFRYYSPQVGFSGKIFSSGAWSLSGAINTELPYVLPEPLGGGYIAEQRTMLFNPGLFSSLVYAPKGSRWSLYGLFKPRAFFYRDRYAAEPQMARSGMGAGLKPELTLNVAPSVNYTLTERTGLRLGTSLTYQKLVASSWNPFRGTLNWKDPSSDAWRVAQIPVQLGITYQVSSALNVSAFVQSYVIHSQRVRADGSHASFAQASSIGMWLNGVML